MELDEVGGNHLQGTPTIHSPPSQLTNKTESISSKKLRLSAHKVTAYQATYGTKEGPPPRGLGVSLNAEGTAALFVGVLLLGIWQIFSPGFPFIRNRGSGPGPGPGAGPGPGPGQDAGPDPE